MPVVGNRIKVASSSAGTGNITLGSAEDGYQTFAAGGISNNDVVRYVITEGSSWEIGKGTYLTSGPTLVRTSGNLLESSTGSLLNLGGSATVFVSLADVDVMQTDGGTFSGDVTFDGDAADIIFDKSHDALAFRQGAALKFASTSSTAQQSRIQWDGTRTHWETFNSTRVDLDGDFRFVGASYNVEWDKSEDALHFNDRATLSFGGTSATPDMWIEHNNLLNLNRIRGSNITIQDYDGSNIAVFQEDAGAALYFNGGLRAEVVTGGFDVTGNITVSGTVDGRDVATDGTKLDGIEAGANVGPSLAVAIALG